MIEAGATPLAILAGHLATIGATLLLVAVWIAGGSRLLGFLHAEHVEWPAPLPLVTSALLGQGLCALLVLVLGAVGLLHPPIVLGVFVLVLVLLRREVVPLASALRRAGLPEGMLPRVTVGAWVVLALVMVVLALAPPWDWDTLMYHQALPLEFLRSGFIRLPPDNLHVALIGVAQLASVPLLAAGLEAGPAMASVASYLLLAAAMVGAARVVGDQDDGWWSVLLLLGVPGFLVVATTARIDVTVAGALVVAHALLLFAVARRDRAVLVVAAACFGIAGGMKLHALLYAAVSAPVVLLAWRDRRALVQALGAFGLALGPWLVKNALLLGAPFYPAGARPRLEPWLAAIVGSSAIPAGFDARVIAQLGASRTTFNLWDAFVHPGLLTIEEEGRYYGLPLVLLLLPVALFALRRRPAVLALALPPLVYLALLLVAFPQTNLRYLFPAIPPLLAATVIGLRASLPRPLPPAARHGLLGVVLAASTVFILPAAAEKIGSGGLLLRWAVGGVSREEVRARVHDVAARDYAALDAALSGLPSDDLVLLLWEGRTEGLRPRTLADIRLSNWSLLSQTAAPASCLSGTGISYVVVNRGALKYYLAGGASQEVLRLKQFDEFAARCLEPLREVRAYLIFRVRSGPPAAGGRAPAS